MKKLILFLLLPLFAMGQPTLSEIDHAFDQIANNYNIPAPLLKAISYTQTKWDTLHSDRGSYGLMALKSKNSISSIETGSRLTGYSEPQGIIDYTKNIEMGAAILVMLRNQGELQGEIIETIEDYYPLIVHFFDRDDRIKNFTADQVFSIYQYINRGYVITRDDAIDLEVKAVTVNFIRMAQILPPLPYATIDSITSLDDSDITFIASPNYSSRENTTIDQVIVHVVQGSMSSCVNWFQNTNAYASSHYVISHKGEIVQMVTLENKAWHAGSKIDAYKGHNERSVGIEHEGAWHASVPDSPFTDIQYRASAMITRWVCDKYNIPKVHRAAFTWNNVAIPSQGGTVDTSISKQPGILGHRDVTGKWTCPGDWDWDKYMGLVIGFSDLTGTTQFVRPLDHSKTTNPVILQTAVTGDVKTVKYFADGDWPLGESSDPSNLFKVSYEFAGVDKVREITVRGYDVDGLQIEGAEHTISFTPSNVGSGTVTLVKPTSDANNPVQFESSVTGVISKVAYYVMLSGGGVYPLDTISSAPFQMERLFTELGDRRVFAYGLDSDDFIIDVVFKDITVFEQAMGTVTITSPTSGVNENPVVVEAAVTGDVAAVEFWEGNILIKRVNNTPFNLMHTFSPGSHTIKAIGYDESGDAIDGAINSVTFSIESEIINNQITFISPSTSTAATNPVSFQVSVSGEITQVQYVIQGETVGPLPAPYRYSHTFPQSGRYTVSVQGLNSSGTQLAENTLQVSVQVDSNPEITLNILSITDGENLDNPAPIKIEASDDITSIKLYDNNSPLLDATGTPYGIIKRPFEIKQHTFEDGKHLLTIEGYDATGNVVKTTFVSFKIGSDSGSDDGGCHYGSNTPVQYLLLLMIPTLWFIRRRKQFKI